MYTAIQDYVAKKAEGLVLAVKSDIDQEVDNANYAIRQKQWDTNTGLELPEKIVSIEKKELLAKRALLVSQIEAIDTFLKDVDAVVVEELTPKA